ncbi:hypothetical protein C0J52_21372 [Blattella germanica]|nr:hypothetical protein C0J52_21372 [Blattella germanica]
MLWSFNDGVVLQLRPMTIAGEPDFSPGGFLLHTHKSSDMALSQLSTHNRHRPGTGPNPLTWEYEASALPTPPRLTNYDA